MLHPGTESRWWCGGGEGDGDIPASSDPADMDDFHSIARIKTILPGQLQYITFTLVFRSPVWM